MAKTRGPKGPATKKTDRKTSTAKMAPKQTRTANGVTKPTQPRGRHTLLNAADKDAVNPKRTTGRPRKVQPEKETEALLVEHVQAVIKPKGNDYAPVEAKKTGRKQEEPFLTSTSANVIPVMSTNKREILLLIFPQ
jgi:hypothetical protein